MSYTAPIKSKISNVKTHIQENKKFYAGVAIGVAIGSTAMVLKSKPALINTVIKGDHNTVNNVIIQALGDPGNVIQCVETGTIYASQGQAARELGISPSVISKHLSGQMKDAAGKTFEVLGKAGQAL